MGIAFVVDLVNGYNFRRRPEIPAACFTIPPAEFILLVIAHYLSLYFTAPGAPRLTYASYLNRLVGMAPGLTSERNLREKPRDNHSNGALDFARVYHGLIEFAATLTTLNPERNVSFSG